MESQEQMNRTERRKKIEALEKEIQELKEGHEAEIKRLKNLLSVRNNQIIKLSLRSQHFQQAALSAQERVDEMIKESERYEDIKRLIYKIANTQENG
jgi:NACalpha-BTF3-like transcription factor